MVRGVKSSIIRQALVAGALTLLVQGMEPAAPAVASQPSPAQKTCDDDAAKPEARIKACTAVISDQKLPADTRADAFATRGSIADDQGRHAEAIADFTAALKLVPNDPATLILRGNALDSSGQHELAIADYSEAIRLNPGDASGYYNRGTVYMDKGEKERALSDFRKALEIEPNYDLAKKAMAQLAK